MAFIDLKNNIDVSNLYDKYTCKCMLIIYCMIKKKIILKHSSSRYVVNYNKRSLHAEQRAIYELNKYKNKNNIDNFIWRYDRKLNIKPCYSCHSCTLLLKKYGYENNIFTFVNNLKVSAITNIPELSFSYKIKNNFI